METRSIRYGRNAGRALIVLAVAWDLGMAIAGIHLIYSLTLAVVTILLQIWIEARRRRYERWRRDRDWDDAARTSNPILWLAQLSYIRSLSKKEWEELDNWMTNVEPEEFLDKFDDAPPVVRNYFALQMRNN